MNTCITGEASTTGKEDRLQENFITNRSDKDPFPDVSFLDTIDDDQEDYFHAVVNEMLENASERCLP